MPLNASLRWKVIASASVPARKARSPVRKVPPPLSQARPPNVARSGDLVPLDAAANVKRLPGHVVAVVGSEKRDHIRNVDPGLRAAYRDLQREKFNRACAIEVLRRANHVQQTLEQLRLDEAGTNRIHRDAG